MKQAVRKLTSGERKKNGCYSVAKIERKKRGKKERKENIKPSLVIIWALGQTTCTAEEIKKHNN